MITKKQIAGRKSSPYKQNNKSRIPFLVEYGIRFLFVANVAVAIRYVLTFQCFVISMYLNFRILHPFRKRVPSSCGCLKRGCGHERMLRVAGTRGSCGVGCLVLQSR